MRTSPISYLAPHLPIPRNMQGKQLLFSVVWLCLGVMAEAQQLVPPIDHFKAFQYNAGSKNWGLAVNERGELYVANNSGLLHFNGQSWSLYKLPNTTVIRSVACIGNRIYTGSYEEFGYWQHNALGQLDYTSLTHLIEGHAFTSEEFWEIIPHGETVVFRSFSAIYVYGNDQIRVIDPDEVVSDIIEYEGKLIVSLGFSGLYELDKDQLIPLEGEDLLEGKTITDMVVIEEGLLVGTKLNGCFLYKGSTTTGWAEEMIPELRQHQLNKIYYLDNGKLVFGTIKNGVYIFDPETRSTEVLNRGVGLQNNTVLALLQYRDQLWIAQDNGLDRVQFNNPYTYFTDTTGAVGTVYDLAFHKGTLYMGTNTGVFYFDNGELRFVEGTQGHVWDLALIDGDLFCGHNTGTFLLEQGELHKLSEISGGYNLVKIPDTDAAYLQGTYVGLAKYHRDVQGKWQVDPVSGINFPVKHLCFEDASTLWAAHAYKGLYRLSLNKDYTRVAEIKEFGNESLPGIYNVKVYNVKNQIVIRSNGLWFKYDPILGNIVPFEQFNAFGQMDLIHFGEGYFWFSAQGFTKEIYYTDLRDDLYILGEGPLRERLETDSENLVRRNDSIYFLTLNDGFARVNLAKFKSTAGKFNLPAPFLAEVSDQDGNLVLQTDEYTFSFKSSREVAFQIACPKLPNPRFRYELKGPVQQQEVSESGDLIFQNLPFGNYHLKVNTVSIDGSRSSPLSVVFTIAPPWYWSVRSRIVYIGLLIGLVLAVRWYNRLKLERKHQLLKEEMHLEQERRLAQIEKDKLAREVRSKQKELASTTMNVAKKNQLILELKNLLFMNKDKFANQQRYRSFMKKLTHAINSDEDWKRFEVNFKELHEDFFETLLVRYPALTPKDLKLCAYLKMNLTSKEIAPLMGITTRGVEIHRYRLRKKLDLEGHVNISNFLITLK